MYMYPREPRHNHLRHSAEPLDRLCQPDPERPPESSCSPDHLPEPLERPPQPESESLTAGAAGAAEPEYEDK